MSKKVVAAFRCVEENDEWKIEKWTEANEAEEIICAGMIIEYLANRYEVTPEEMAEILLKNISSSPMEFEDKARNSDE